jgi:precorrin-6A synthase
MNRKVLVIGIGAGDPGYMTVQAIDALNRADVLFLPDKGSEKAALHRIRRDICERFIREDAYRTVTYAVPERRRDPDYASEVDAWHEEVGAVFERLIAEELDEGREGAFLVWGDPAFYDSTIRILRRLRARPGLALDYEVIPGISAPQALAARHGISLTRPGAPLLVAAGRALAAGMPGGGDGAVVMLDVASGLRGADPDSQVYWGANLGTADEVLVAGRLREVIGEIDRARSEIRRKAGWVMETCFLAPKGTPP